jgi:hypothetical protein
MMHNVIEKVNIAFTEANRSAIDLITLTEDEVVCIKPHLWMQLREAIQALAAQPAAQEPVADAWMHKDGRLTDAKAKTARVENFHGWRPLAFIASTTPPAAQPAVPDAIHHTDLSEHPQYIEGWNDCRQAMMEMMK